MEEKKTEKKAERKIELTPLELRILTEGCLYTRNDLTPTPEERAAFVSLYDKMIEYWRYCDCEDDDGSTECWFLNKYNEQNGIPERYVGPYFGGAKVIRVKPKDKKTVRVKAEKKSLIK